MHSVLEFPSPMVARFNEDVFEQIAALIVEGRTPLHILKASVDPPDLSKKWNKSYSEGLHCQKLGSGNQCGHKCSDSEALCIRYNNLKQQIVKISSESDVVIEVFLTTTCPCAELRSRSTLINAPVDKDDLLLEQWTFTRFPNGADVCILSLNNAVRSLLHFSQLAAWYMRYDGRLPAHVVYRVCSLAEAQNPGEQYVIHDFPATGTNSISSIKLRLKSYPRVENLPNIACVTHSTCELTRETAKQQSAIPNNSNTTTELFRTPNPLLDRHKIAMLDCQPAKLPLKFQKKELTITQRKCFDLKDMYTLLDEDNDILDGLVFHETARSRQRLKKETTSLVDDRMKVPCPMSGKHHCQVENDEEGLCDDGKPKRRRSLSKLTADIDKGKVLHGKFRDVELHGSLSPKLKDDRGLSSCDNPNPFLEAIIRCHDKSNTNYCDIKSKKLSAVRNLSAFDNHKADFNDSLFFENKLRSLKLLFSKEQPASNFTESAAEREWSSKVPSTKDQIRFRRSLDSAAQLVFHRCSGLPLTSSPAPIRRKNASFAFDSTLNSISAIKGACIEPDISSEDIESEGATSVPVSPTVSAAPTFQRRLQRSSLPLLGSFEESVLNGRIEPESTVHGYTAELGASGEFLPRHKFYPVTVFFYKCGESEKKSTPYMAHLNLDWKGYVIPRSGTIQVTLFNPHKTVVKIFVVRYNFEDMPPSSHTFLRQRNKQVDTRNDVLFSQQPVCYVIHLRFITSSSGRMYLHTDVRMLISRNAETSSFVEDEEGNRVVAQVIGPENPKYSPL